MESMWRDLPADVVERVFTFLPISSLCRFRTLSKEWNRLISCSSPTSFKHARASSEEDYTLITPRRGWPELPGAWEVLDVAKERPFTLSDVAFLTEYVQRRWLLHGFPLPKSVQSFLVAADGGLFCVLCITENLHITEVEASPVLLMVCNPVLKTVKQLPHVPGKEAWNYFLIDMVVMATDRSSMEYEIAVVKPAAGKDGFKVEQICFYESKTGRWRTISPFPPSSNHISGSPPTTFNNSLYYIVDRGDGSCNGLVSCNKETSAWSDLGPSIDFPWPGIDFRYASMVDLVVSNARLFCVITVDNFANQFDSVEIFEIDVVKKVSTWLTGIPPALLITILGKDYKNGGLYSTWETSGSADCIFIATVVGRCAEYSLSRNSWHLFPEDCTPLKAYKYNGETTVSASVHHSRAPTFFVLED